MKQFLEKWWTSLVWNHFVCSLKPFVFILPLLFKHAQDSQLSQQYKTILAALVFPASFSAPVVVNLQNYKSRFYKHSSLKLLRYKLVWYSCISKHSLRKVSVSDMNHLLLFQLHHKKNQRSPVSSYPEDPNHLFYNINFLSPRYELHLMQICVHKRATIHLENVFHFVLCVLEVLYPTYRVRYC